MAMPSSSGYLNVQSEPLNLPGGSLGGGFFRSTTLRSESGQSDAELGNSYTSMSDDEALQDGFAERWSSSSVGEIMRSAMPGFLIRSADEPAPETKQGLFAGAREAISDRKALLRTITPGFLRTEEEDDFGSSCFPSLSLKQRLFGCVCCFCLGQFLQFLSIGALMGVLIGHPESFAWRYSGGNLMMMAASVFLAGPKAQFRKFRDKDRALTSSVFLASMILTLVAVFAHPFFGRALVVLLLVVVQWMAQIWYILSYVPYGHSMGRNVLRRLGRCICTF